MRNTLNWGLVSTARINRRLIPAFRQASRSEIIGVGSRSEAKASEFAAEWDIPQVFTSYESLLASPEIDAVYIPLPNTLHKEWVIKAAEAGKHILCEKPLALTVSEVDEMLEAAKQNGVILQESFQYHFHPQLLKLKSVLTEGQIGPMSYVRARFSFPLPADRDNIRLKKSLGGGSLWDVGSYASSFVLSVVDSPLVAVQGWQRVNDTGADVIFAGQIRFENGVLAQIDSGFEMSYRIGAELAGEEGVIYVDNPWQPDLDGRGSGLRYVDHFGNETRIPTESKDPYLCSVEAIEASIFDQTPPVYTLEQTRTNIAVINALYQSAETGQVVAL